LLVEAWGAVIKRQGAGISITFKTDVYANGHTKTTDKASDVTFESGELRYTRKQGGGSRAETACLTTDGELTIPCAHDSSAQIATYSKDASEVKQALSKLPQGTGWLDFVTALSNAASQIH
jgi:hypothetical protein